LADDRLITISKLMSLMLRHDPAEFGLVIVFYRANDNFWLVDYLPAVFLRTVG